MGLCREGPRRPHSQQCRRQQLQSQPPQFEASCTSVPGRVEPRRYTPRGCSRWCSPAFKCSHTPPGRLGLPEMWRHGVRKEVRVPVRPTEAADRAAELPTITRQWCPSLGSRGGWRGNEDSSFRNVTSYGNTFQIGASYCRREWITGFKTRREYRVGNQID